MTSGIPGYLLSLFFQATVAFIAIITSLGYLISVIPVTLTIAYFCYLCYLLNIDDIHVVSYRVFVVKEALLPGNYSISGYYLCYLWDTWISVIPVMSTIAFFVTCVTYIIDDIHVDSYRTFIARDFSSRRQ